MVEPENPSRSAAANNELVSGSARHRRSLYWILGLAALLRCAWIPVHQFHHDRLSTVDSALYLDLAESLAQTGRFERTWRAGGFALEATGPVEVFRTPGYPLFLAGVRSLPGSSTVWLVLLQIVLGFSTVGLTYLLARRLVSAPRALAAAALLAWDPGQMLYAQLVMSDTLFAGLVVLCSWLTTRVANRPSASSIFALGTALSAATSVRPLGLVLLLPALGFLSASRLGRRALVPVLVLGLLFPVAWAARNSARSGFSGVSNAFDLNLALVATPKVLANATGEPRWQVSGRLLADLRPRLENADLTERGQIFRRLAFETAAEHPVATATALGWTAVEMLFAGERRVPLQLLGIDSGGPSLGEERGGNEGLFAALRRRGLGELVVLGLQTAWNLMLWILAVRGTVRLVRQRAWSVLALTLAVVALVLAPSLVVGTARMRLPITAMMAILAAAGLGNHRSASIFSPHITP